MPLFFVGLSVVIAGLARSGATEWFLARWPLVAGEVGAIGAWRSRGLLLAGSNFVYKLPFMLLVQDEVVRFEIRELASELLAMASTFVGHFTLLGGVADVIGAERGREVGGMGFFACLRIGLPLAAVTTALGAA